MRVKTGWIYGLPGDINEQHESLRLMHDLRPHEISIHQLIPFPGTTYYDRPGDYGIRIRDPKDFQSFCYGGVSENISYDYLSARELFELLAETVESLERAGYVDSDRATSQDEYIFSTPLNSLSMRVFQETV
jgi:anaerobic magnesium-protoporphyrin IX monomethyl ester cyclase